MTKELLTKWLAALRSGTYLQYQGKLKGKLRNGQLGYCCLGVLCDVLEKEEGIGHWDNDPVAGDDCFFYNGSHDLCYPPEAIRLKLGLGLPCSQGSLVAPWAAMNDRGFSFEEIAADIETHYQK